MRLGAALTAGALCLGLTACSAGSLGSSDDDSSGKTAITFLTNNDPANVKVAEAVIAAFETEEPGVDVTLDTRPQGSEGDNLVKTRLATGDMADVFEYNSGSLFQALAPQANLTPVSAEPWVGDLDPTFKQVVTAGTDVYGSPWGSVVGGGIFYNLPLYAELGLQVPKTWAGFMANNARIKQAGVAPVEQTYSETWTSQVLVLADFHNVAAAHPGFAEQYTANKAKFATTPAALAGFQHLADLKAAGYFNDDFASAKYNEGLAAVATGKAGHYPMITFGVPALSTAAPDNVDDVGFFALPGDDAAKNGATLWEPSGIYIPKSTEGDKLAAAKKFQSFVASPKGCAAYAGAAPVGGPFAVRTCPLPDTVAPAVKHLSAYVEAGAASPALEFLSPIKGPALEQITVEVGSGIREPAAGAKLYDEDVKKQAQQLGLTGW
ncbi:ABC transporter substrate-binding protein [Actinoplanes sp. RD1]|uniref:ABC transporter substrate-binding protein n=1 Tax=Actinoplanes sp. RD1 TaxID=3064538 RepID=UPI002741857C|nr:extracellular solute-binding protein [Actinoplanes sp. RD1]